MKKELLFSVTKKDLKVEYFSGTGAGGQHRNKHQNCIRIHHLASGTIVTGQSSRERVANRREAIKNLLKHPKYKMWQNLQVQEKLIGQSIEEVVEKMVIPEYLKIEVKEDGKWVTSTAWEMLTRN